MDYSKFRKLSSDDIIKLHDQAKTGDPASMVGFACFAIWRRIKREQSIKPKARIKLYNDLIRSVRFKVKQGRKTVTV